MSCTVSMHINDSSLRSIIAILRPDFCCRLDHLELFLCTIFLDKDKIILYNFFFKEWILHWSAVALKSLA